MTTHHYSNVAVHGELGGVMRLTRRTRIFISDPATGLPVDVTQGALTAPYVDSDEHGRVDFTAEDKPWPLRWTNGNVFMDVYPLEAAEAMRDAVVVAEAAHVASRTAGDLYMPSASCLLTWRAARAQATSGASTAHIAVLGDSIAFGAAAFGSTPPKNKTSWPGRLRAMIDADHGASGTGIIPMIPALLTNPTWSDDLTFGGSISGTTVFLGFHANSTFEISAAEYIEVDHPDCDEFWIYALNGNNSSLNDVTVDGGAVGTVMNSIGSLSPTYARESGFHSSMIVTRVPAGSAGAHALRITRPAGATGVGYVIAIEARRSAAGRIRVSNLGYSSKSVLSFLTGNNEANGYVGLPLLDMTGADLLVMSLGVNDWQGQIATALTKTRIGSIITRQRETGVNAGGGAKAGGDVMLMWNPKPDTATLGGGAYTNPTWDAYRAMFYELADEYDVALLDLGGSWKDFAAANAVGMYADTIHPSDRGAMDIAAQAYRAIMGAV